MSNRLDEIRKKFLAICEKHKIVEKPNYEELIFEEEVMRLFEAYYLELVTAAKPEKDTDNYITEEGAMRAAAYNLAIFDYETNLRAAIKGKE